MLACYADQWTGKPETWRSIDLCDWQDGVSLRATPIQTRKAVDAYDKLAVDSRLPLFIIEHPETVLQRPALGHLLYEEQMPMSRSRRALSVVLQRPARRALPLLSQQRTRQTARD
jgi:hypothetical protein